MHTKNFLNHQNDRQIGFTSRCCIKSRHLEAIDFISGLTCFEAIGWGFDGRLRHDGHGSSCIAHAQRGFKRRAAAGIGFSALAGQQGIKFVFLVIVQHAIS